MRIPFFLLALFLALFQSSYAQKYAFVTYSTEEGLPQSQVTAICQDKDGYLWVATLGGLAKFNGNEFTTFSSTHGLLNNRVTALSFIGNTLWIGHDGGVSYMRGGKIRKIGFGGTEQSRKVSEIIEFKGKIFICTTQGGIYTTDGNTLKKIAIDKSYDYIRSAHVHGDKLYLATREGMLYSTDGKRFRLYKEVPDPAYFTVVGNDRYLYFCTWKFGIYRKDLRTGKFDFFPPEKLGHNIYEGYIDRQGTVWLKTFEGILRLHENGEIDFTSQDQGLPIDIANCFFEDGEGNIWIGSEGKGMFRFQGETFRYYDQTTVFPTDLFISGFQKKNGDFYIGTYDQGVLRWNGKDEPVKVSETSLPIWASLEGVDGKDWFGTQSGLFSIDKQGKIETLERDERLPGLKVSALYKINNREMYIGGSEGVVHYKSGEYIRLDKQRKDLIGTVRDFVVLDGAMYCVTNLGVFAYKNGEFKKAWGLGSVVYNAEKDGLNQLWFGAEEGLFRVRNSTLEKVPLLKNPASNYINFLVYREDELFVGTNNGLFVLSELDRDEPNIKRFGTGEGVVDLETNLNSGFFDNKGNFWFGTASGLVCYHRNEMKRKEPAPLIQLKSILLNYQPFDYTQYSVGEINEKGLPPSLTLPYSKNSLIFEMDGISLAHYRGLSYQFFLEGLNDEWSPLSDNPVITFTNLPAGDYNLRVRSVDMDGRTSDEIVFPFTVEQAFYKTWWFILLVFLSIAGLVFLFFKRRIQRVREINEKEKLGYMARLIALEQQSMNASMNRHFVFNSLNSIQYFINTQDRHSANKYLTNFAQLIRKNLDSATAEGNMITLEEELERLRLYLSLESMRFKDRFDYKINVEGVDTESIKIPAMIMQPFIENSIIHGILPDTEKKGLIEIDISNKNGQLNIAILDNGIGVNQSMHRKATVDGDHNSKGMEITSKRIELIQKVSENEISLEGPKEIVGENGSISGTHVLIKMPLVDLEN